MSLLLYWTVYIGHWGIKRNNEKSRLNIFKIQLQIVVNIKRNPHYIQNIKAKVFFIVNVIFEGLHNIKKIFSEIFISLKKDQEKKICTIVYNLEEMTSV